MLDSLEMAQSTSKYCPYCGGCTERYLSVETAATVLDCSVDTIRSWIRERRITSVKIGRLRRIPASALDKMVIEYPSLGEVVESAVRP